MRLPCPFFAVDFGPFVDVEEGVGVSVVTLGGGSSSEKDSHAGSSFVTAVMSVCASFAVLNSKRGKTGLGSPHRLSASSSS